MPVLRALSAPDAGAVASLWQAANDRRRHELGVPPVDEPLDILTRPAAFAVGVSEGPDLLSMAAALPARADDGRSVHNVPGLAHISSVATLTGHWGQGFGATCLRAILFQASRRGYARAQLFTHTSNARARRLYERAGFELSGRTRPDRRGDLLMHYLHELSPIPRTHRPAARLVCIDPDDRVLLLRWRDPFDGYVLWEPPGGGIEPGETSYDAVVREWHEETGLPTPTMDGAVTAVARELVFNGNRCVVDEDFYLGRLPAALEPQPTAATLVEQETYLGSAWVAWHELESLADPVEPDLLPVLQRLAPDGPWGWPQHTTLNW